MPGNLKKKSAIIIYFKLVDVMNIKMYPID